MGQKVICCRLSDVSGQRYRAASVDKKNPYEGATNSGARAVNDTTNNWHYNPENPWQISPGLSAGEMVIRVI
jgi:hypothetical protein